MKTNMAVIQMLLSKRATTRILQCNVSEKVFPHENVHSNSYHTVYITYFAIKLAVSSLHVLEPMLLWEPKIMYKPRKLYNVKREMNLLGAYVSTYLTANIIHCNDQPG
jgi:hypothetical protein